MQRKMLHIKQKENRLKEIKEKILKRNPKNAFEYMSIVNSITLSRKHESRKRVIMMREDFKNLKLQRKDVTQSEKKKILNKYYKTLN